MPRFLNALLPLPWHEPISNSDPARHHSRRECDPSTDLLVGAHVTADPYTGISEAPRWRAPPPSSWDDFMWTAALRRAASIFLSPASDFGSQPFPLSFKTAAEQHGSGPDAIIYLRSILLG